MSLDKTKEYTYEDMQGKSDKEVTEMLKHNKRLKGWDESQEVVSNNIIKCISCDFERKLEDWEILNNLTCQNCSGRFELK